MHTMLVALEHGTEFEITDDMTEDTIGTILFAKGMEDRLRGQRNDKQKKEV